MTSQSNGDNEYKFDRECTITRDQAFPGSFLESHRQESSALVMQQVEVLQRLLCDEKVEDLQKYQTEINEALQALSIRLDEQVGGSLEGFRRLALRWVLTLPPGVDTLPEDAPGTTHNSSASVLPSLYEEIARLRKQVAEAHLRNQSLRSEARDAESAMQQYRSVVEQPAAPFGLPNLGERIERLVRLGEELADESGKVRAFAVAAALPTANAAEQGNVDSWFRRDLANTPMDGTEVEEMANAVKTS